jgi:hypothetical protein
MTVTPPGDGTPLCNHFEANELLTSLQYKAHQKLIFQITISTTKNSITLTNALNLRNYIS